MIRYYSSLQIGWRINFRTVFLVIRLEKGATFIYFYVFFFARFLVGFVRGFDLEVFCIFYRNVDGGFCVGLLRLCIVWCVSDRRDLPRLLCGAENVGTIGPVCQAMWVLTKSITFFLFLLCLLRCFCKRVQCGCVALACSRVSLDLGIFLIGEIADI